MSEETQKPKQSDAEESDEKNSGSDRSPVTTERDLSTNQAPTGDPQTDPKDTGDQRGSTDSESPTTVDRGGEVSKSKPTVPEDQLEEKTANDLND